jgi:hypothetical protein
MKKKHSITPFQVSRIGRKHQKRSKSLVSTSPISGKSVQNLENTSRVINFYGWIPVLYKVGTALEGTILKYKT